MSRTREILIPAAAAKLAAVINTPAAAGNGKVVIFCHGFRGTKEGGGRATVLAEKVASLGFATVSFDFTRHGTLSRQVEELSAVVSYSRQAISPHVILCGRSMGGSAALAYTAADAQVTGLGLWATPHDLHTTFRLALGEGYETLARGDNLDIADEYGHLHLTPAFLHDFDRYDLLACVQSLSGRPLFVVHGQNDAVVPVCQAHELYEQAGDPKEIVIVAGGDHQFLFGHQQASDAVLSWLSRADTAARP